MDIERPAILGADPINPNKIYKLKVPAFFEFQRIPLSEFEMKRTPRIRNQIEPMFAIRNVLSNHPDPSRNSSLNEEDTVLMNFFLASSPLPGNQGPVIPCVDNYELDPKGEKLHT